MIIAVDVGNTNIKFGLFDNNKMVASWRMATVVTRTADEYGAMLVQLLSLDHKEYKINGAIISSVIPQLNYTIEHMLSYFFHVKPLVVGVGIKTGINIRYENPRELGTDRIIGCVGALKKYGAPFILIDFGTATTFNAVDDKGNFLGGCITLGIKASVEGLATNTAKLPRVELVRTDSAIGRTTVKNIQAGATYGVIGQVKYIIEKIEEDMDCTDVKIVATGGLSELLRDEKLIDVIDRELSLEGLNTIYNLNVNN